MRNLLDLMELVGVIVNWWLGKNTPLKGHHHAIIQLNQTALQVLKVSLFLGLSVVNILSLNFCVFLSNFKIGIINYGLDTQGMYFESGKEYSGSAYIKAHVKSTVVFSLVDVVLISKYYLIYLFYLFFINFILFYDIS